MHGFHGKIIGSDQCAWPWANTAGVTPFGGGLEKNTLTIGSGETYEWLLDFGQQTLQSTYDKTPGGAVALAATQSRMNNTVNAAGVLSNVKCDPNPLIALNAPMPNTRTDCAPIPDPFAVPYNYIGGPTVGPGPGDTNSEAAVLAAGGTPPGVAIPGQFFPFHNHDDYKATNNGV